MTQLLKKSVFKGGFKMYYQVKASHDRGREGDKVFRNSKLSKQKPWEGSLPHSSAEI